MEQRRETGELSAIAEVESSKLSASGSPFRGKFASSRCIEALWLDSKRSIIVELRLLVNKRTPAVPARR